MTQPMTRGHNLQLPYYQVILLIPASEAQGTGPFKALWSHGKNTILYELSAKFFFFFPLHTQKSLDLQFIRMLQGYTAVIQQISLF